MFPVLAFYLPFDAVASIMDGSLLGAGEHYLLAAPWIPISHALPSQLQPSGCNLWHASFSAVPPEVVPGAGAAAASMYHLGAVTAPHAVVQETPGTWVVPCWSQAQSQPGHCTMSSTCGPTLVTPHIMSATGCRSLYLPPCDRLKVWTLVH